MAVLLLLIGISPLATDMYLASLPAMGSSLGAATATIQLTLTGFLIGHAVGQLAIGPISDGMGRRPFLIGGSAAFFIRSPVCAVAPNDPVLAAARVAQGFASAAGIVFGKAVINDYFPCHRADRRCAIVTPLCHGLSWPQPRNGICCWAAGPRFAVHGGLERSLRLTCTQSPNTMWDAVARMAVAWEDAKVNRTARAGRSHPVA